MYIFISKLYTHEILCFDLGTEMNNKHCLKLRTQYVVHRVGAQGLAAYCFYPYMLQESLDILDPNKHEEAINLTWRNIHAFWAINSQPQFVIYSI